MASKNKVEYRKQVARIKRAMSKIKRAGYNFPELPLPDEEPARVTKKNIETLKSITPRYLRSIATPPISSIGEPKKPAGSIAHKSSQKPQETTVTSQEITQQTPPEEQEIVTAPIDHKFIAIVDAFKNDIREVAAMMRSRVLPKGDVDITEPRSLVFIDRLVSAFGYERIATMIETAIANGESARFEVLYHDPDNLKWINELESFIQKLSEDEEVTSTDILSDMWSSNYSRDEIFSAYDDAGGEFEIERSQ